MSHNQLSPEELEGQRLANELTLKFKMLADKRIDEAVKNLPIQQEQSSKDIKKLCDSIEKAIKSLSVNGSDSAIASSELIKKQVESVKAASSTTNELLAELIEIASTPKIVKYDNFGRIIEIARKGDR